jgi:hypothetical protein
MSELWDPIEAVEHLRRKLRGMDYKRIDDAEVARLRQANEQGRANDTIEGIEPSEGGEALHEMLLDERVPCELEAVVVKQWLKMTLGDPLRDTPAAGPRM